MIDNINASVVPLPVALWMFVSGLGLLGGCHLRTSRSAEQN